MYSTEDLVQIESVISELQSGEGEVSASYGDHTVKYTERFAAQFPE